MDQKNEDNVFKAEQQEATEYNLAEGTQQLERGLKSRHIQFLALGMYQLELPVNHET